MVLAWMLWSLDAVKQKPSYGLGMDAWASDAVKKERYKGLGMDALVIGCSRA